MGRVIITVSPFPQKSLPNPFWRPQQGRFRCKIRYVGMDGERTCRSLISIPQNNKTDCRKTYITKRVVRPTPINPQKAATCAWLFALLKGGAPRWSGGRTAILSLVRCPDGHTFFAFLRTTGPARERSMGAAARRQRGSAVWERRHSASPLQKLEKVA